MIQDSFGDILRNERERKGFELNAVARRLRIRPDILEAIENADFPHMPPRGYARNMVNAYARFLGLNSTEVTRRYLDEAYAEQMREAQMSSRSTGFRMEDSNRRTTRQTPQTPRTPRTRSSYERTQQQNGRVLLVDSNTSRYRNTESGNTYSSDRMSRARGVSTSGAQYTNFYAGPKAQSSLKSKLPLIIAGVAVLVLLIVLLVSFFGPKKTVDEDIQKVPVTGVEEQAQTPIEEPVEKAVVEQPPTKVDLKYVVSAGTNSWVDVYLDDVLVDGGDVVGEAEESYEVTGKIELVFSNPSAIQLYVDGEETNFTEDYGGGVQGIVLDFEEILAQWKTDHPEVASSASE